VDETSFTTTKTDLSGELEESINDKFGIDWKRTQYRDLRKPLYSGIAARLKIAAHYRYRYASIPQSVAEQSRYWANFYTSKSTATAVDDYTKASDAVANGKIF